MKHLKIILVMLIGTLFLYSCQKDAISTTPNTNATNNTNVQNSGSVLRLKYKDSIVFIKQLGVANTILPTSVPNVSGRFKAIPKGLQIDSITGKIDITQSETGLRYKIYYVSPNTNTPIDSFKMVISGIDYKDAIYELASTPNAYDTAFPIYNANRLLPLPCPGDDDDDDDDACIFDETDLNNDGNDDIAGVIQDKLLVDKKRGTIDVEASFHAGVFGSSTPVNGTTKDFTFYYRLKDASNLALNKIKVRLMVYKYRSNIPQSVLQQLNNTTDLENYTNARLAEMLGRPKRPPVIIIVTN